MNNHFILSHIPKQIIDHNKLYIGTKYLIKYCDDTDFRCGILIQKYINDYGLNIYFLMGHAFYEPNVLSEQIWQYHIQSSNLIYIRPEFYEYYLNNDLQYQIKYSFYIKYVKYICKKNKIGYDCEKQILQYLKF